MNPSRAPIALSTLVSASSTAVAVATPQIAFRPKRLLYMGPPGVFRIRSIRVGRNELLVDQTPIAAELFGHDLVERAIVQSGTVELLDKLGDAAAFDNLSVSRLCQPTMQLSITVENIEPAYRTERFDVDGPGFRPTPGRRWWQFWIPRVESYPVKIPQKRDVETPPTMFEALIVGETPDAWSCGMCGAFFDSEADWETHLGKDRRCPDRHRLPSSEPTT